jgi:hypothetical protein
MIMVTIQCKKIQAKSGIQAKHGEHYMDPQEGRAQHVPRGGEGRGGGVIEY